MSQGGLNGSCKLAGRLCPAPPPSPRRPSTRCTMPTPHPAFHAPTPSPFPLPLPLPLPCAPLSPRPPLGPVAPWASEGTAGLPPGCRHPPCGPTAPTGRGRRRLRAPGCTRAAPKSPRRRMRAGSRPAAAEPRGPRPALRVCSTSCHEGHVGHGAALGWVLELPGRASQDPWDGPAWPSPSRLESRPRPAPNACPTCYAQTAWHDRHPAAPQQAAPCCWLAGSPARSPSPHPPHAGATPSSLSASRRRRCSSAEGKRQ